MRGNQITQNRNTTNAAPEKCEIHPTQNTISEQCGSTDGDEEEICTRDEETANQSNINRPTTDQPEERTR